MNSISFFVLKQLSCWHTYNPFLVSKKNPSLKLVQLLVWRDLYAKNLNNSSFLMENCHKQKWCWRNPFPLLLKTEVAFEENLLKRQIFKVKHITVWFKRKLKVFCEKKDK